jgi:3-oxoacyl-[acyl-carrier protein] reductase
MLPGDPGGARRADPRGTAWQPGEVADLVMALVRNGYITNHVIGIDGGVFPSS